MSADTRTTAELADALDARAAEFDNVEPHSGLDDDPRCIAEAALLRAASARLRAMDAALKPFAECADQLDATADTPRAPDGEWAKFRLLTDHYRAARTARGES